MGSWSHFGKMFRMMMKINLRMKSILNLLYTRNVLLELQKNKNGSTRILNRLFFFYLALYKAKIQEHIVRTVLSIIITVKEIFSYIITLQFRIY